MESNGERKRKERLAEGEFKKWLDKHEIPYWYIQQDIDTFSKALRKYMSRPEQRNYATHKYPK